MKYKWLYSFTIEFCKPFYPDTYTAGVMSRIYAMLTPFSQHYDHLFLNIGQNKFKSNVFLDHVPCTKNYQWLEAAWLCLDFSRFGAKCHIAIVYITLRYHLLILLSCVRHWLFTCRKLNKFMFLPKWTVEDFYIFL